MEAFPARNVMRATNASGTTVHRAAVPDADGSRMMCPRHQFQAFRQLGANAFSALRGINDPAFACENLPFRVSGANLQLAAADLNGKKARTR